MVFIFDDIAFQGLSEQFLDGRLKGIYNGLWELLLEDLMMYFGSNVEKGGLLQGACLRPSSESLSACMLLLMSLSACSAPYQEIRFSLWS